MAMSRKHYRQAAAFLADYPEDSGIPKTEALAFFLTFFGEDNRAFGYQKFRDAGEYKPKLTQPS